MGTVQFHEKLKEAARKLILYTPHAVKQMNSEERMITTKDVENIIYEGKLIEDYPDDVRGHSCLIMGGGEDGRAVHVVCALQDEYIAIITAYIPNLEDWEEGFKERKR